MCFLFVKQTCIIPKLNSNSHQSPRKIGWDSIPSKSFKVFFDHCHCQKSFKNFDQVFLVKENFDSDNRPLVLASSILHMDILIDMLDYWGLGFIREKNLFVKHAETCNKCL
jgi:hypothetical protein